MDLHKQRLTDMKHRIDTEKPETFDMQLSKGKRAMLEKERQYEIDRVGLEAIFSFRKSGAAFLVLLAGPGSCSQASPWGVLTASQPLVLRLLGPALLPYVGERHLTSEDGSH